MAQWPAEDPSEIIRQSVHNYFAYGSKFTELEFRRLMDQGRKTLIIGLTFLATCCT